MKLTLLILVHVFLTTALANPRERTEPHQICWEECIEEGGSAAFCEGESALNVDKIALMASPIPPEICWTMQLSTQTRKEFGYSDQISL
jgi:hypothetical protein